LSTTARLGRNAGLALVLGAIAGCGGSATTVTLTKTVTTAARTSAVTDTGAASNAPASSASSFSGIGPKTLGTISIPLNSTLDWTCSGHCGRFTVANDASDSNTIAVDAGGSSGSVPVVAGTYHQVRVTTSGHWAVAIVAAGGP
jgi:hypothetical protein